MESDFRKWFTDELVVPKIGHCVICGFVTKYGVLRGDKIDLPESFFGFSNWVAKCIKYEQRIKSKKNPLRAKQILKVLKCKLVPII